MQFTGMYFLKLGAKRTDDVINVRNNDFRSAIPKQKAYFGFWYKTFNNLLLLIQQLTCILEHVL